MDLVEQVVDILGRKVELIAVPFAVHAVLVVVQLVPTLHMERYREDLEANWTLYMAHAVIVLI